jgi:hypothetical protein
MAAYGENLMATVTATSSARSTRSSVAFASAIAAPKLAQAVMLPSSTASAAGSVCWARSRFDERLKIALSDTHALGASTA